MPQPSRRAVLGMLGAVPLAAGGVLTSAAATLAGNQPNSPAAGHVYAKTGTGGLATPTGGAMLHKALAGYIELPSRRWLTFAQFMRQETTFEAVRALGDQAQEAMAEIATAVYETLTRSPR